MTLKDSIALAYKTVTSNKVRTGITVAIIAFGIMALIGIITAIEAMNQSLRESFSVMGANAFSIRYKESRGVRFGGPPKRDVTKANARRKEKKANLDKPINLIEAEAFKAAFNYQAAVSIYLRGPGSQEVAYESKKTNPVITMWGGDENYLVVNGYQIQLGRNFSMLDVETGRNVCIIGSGVAAKLFPQNPEKCIEKIIRVGSLPYRVVGLLKEKGASSMLRLDDIVITSYNNIRRIPGIANSYLVGVIAGSVQELESAKGEAIAAFRAVRKLPPADEDNFVLEGSDKFAETFISLLSSITGSAGAIGLITLIGAAIGLMNIMLVAVNERTREVGLIKAIGGRRKHVRRQFLFESVIISLLGAFFGIILGVLVGNLFSAVLGTGFVVPWMWVLTGIIICTIVGLAAGIYPAVKASKLNPIVALRYE
jgi:putative ABC transport system permease protein